MDMDAANDERDKRLRRMLLGVLYEARNSPTGGLSARLLKDLVTPMVFGGPGFENDDHALALMRDLKLAGLASETATGKRKEYQRNLIDFREFAITDAGVTLYKQERPKHPLVADDRADDE